MPRTDYRPSIGETVFVSLSGNAPLLITITGFHFHTYLKEDVMDFDRLDGSSSWSSYKGQTFFPEVSADTPYLYFLVLNCEDYDGRSDYRDEAFFFTPEAAFAHLTALETGEIKPENVSSHDNPDYIIEVRKVT